MRWGGRGCCSGSTSGRWAGPAKTWWACGCSGGRGGGRCGSLEVGLESLYRCSSSSAPNDLHTRAHQAPSSGVHSASLSKGPPLAGLGINLSQTTIHSHARHHHNYTHTRSHTPWLHSVTHGVLQSQALHGCRPWPIKSLQQGLRAINKKRQSPKNCQRALSTTGHSLFIEPL